MNTDTQIAALEQKVQSLIQDDPGVFLVGIRIKPTNNVKVFLDSDTGMSLEKLVQYNRRLYRALEETAFFPGNDFSLEISSPGLDEPLKMHRQYVKNTGRAVEVICNDGTRVEGKLVRVGDAEIEVEAETEKKNKHKKKEKQEERVSHIIPFDNIKTTKVQIKF